MKTLSISTFAWLATLTFGATFGMAASPKTETFPYCESGISSVKVGADYASVPVSCPGLYSRAEYRVCCGGEDGDGVEILYFDGNSQNFIIRAFLNLDDSTIETLYEEGLGCNSYPITDAKVANLLRESGSTTIEGVNVAPSPHITVNVSGQEIATSEPAVKFMALPGAVTTVSLAEGLYVNCEIGGLNMEIMNAYEAINPDALEAISNKLAAGIEAGDFRPVKVSPTVVNPKVRFDSFYYSPAN